MLELEADFGSLEAETERIIPVSLKQRRREELIRSTNSGGRLFMSPIVCLKQSGLVTNSIVLG